MYLGDGLVELFPDRRLLLPEYVPQVLPYCSSTPGRVVTKIRIKLPKQLLQVSTLEGGKWQVRIDNVADRQLSDPRDLCSGNNRGSRSRSFHRCPFLKVDDGGLVR